MGEAARSRVIFSLSGGGSAHWILTLAEEEKAPSDFTELPEKMFPAPPFVNAVKVCKSHLKGSATYRDWSFSDH